MDASKHGEISQDLARAAARFSAWRRATQLGARIPPALWGLAVELAQQHGVSRTAAALKLDYYSLKKRLAASGSGRQSSPPSALRPAFVELPAGPFAATGECLIELENAAGAKMRIHLKGSAMPDLAALGRDFWGVG